MKFLIVKTSSLGDIIQTFPVVEYLKSRFPDSQIDWVVEKPFAELVRTHPLIYRTLVVSTKKWRRIFPLVRNLKDIKQTLGELRAVHYDVLFDFQGNSKSGLITLLASADQKVGYACKSVPEWPNLLATNVRFDLPTGENIRQDYLNLARQFFKDAHSFTPQGIRLKISEEQKGYVNQFLGDRITKTLLICPGSTWRNKQISESTLGNLLQIISQNYTCRFLLLWGSQEEKECVEKLWKKFPHAEIVEKLALPTLQNLMEEVDLVLSMDSLPLHLAGTTSTPTFSVFGASLGSKYVPLGSEHRYLQGSCQYGKTFEKRCPALRKCGTGSCIRELSAETIFQSFQSHCEKYLR